MNRSIQAFAFAIILLGLTATRARADLAISLSNVSLAPGGTGTMDINVTSNSSDTLSAFNLELLITPVGTPTSLLQFTSSQPDFSGNPSYVFANESLLGPAFWSTPPTTTNYPNDTIFGGDFAYSNGAFSYVTITGTSLLATVQFQAPLGATLGDQFQISLVNDPSFTYFDDQNGNALNYSVGSTGGTVTITSVVPEPSSLTVVALSGLSGLLWCCWRGRKHGLLKNSPVATPFPPTDPAVLP